jgi:hypothetical protein
VRGDRLGDVFDELSKRADLAHERIELGLQIGQRNFLQRDDAMAHFADLARDIGSSAGEALEAVGLLGAVAATRG